MDINYSEVQEFIPSISKLKNSQFASESIPVSMGDEGKAKGAAKSLTEPSVSFAGTSRLVPLMCRLD